MSHIGLEESGAAPGTPQGPREAPAGRLELAVVVVEDARGFDALEEEWSDLLERSDASVFQSFEWQRTWWRHFGERRGNARLHLVTVRGRDGLVAIAPFYVERSLVLGALPLRRLLFVGHLASDYLDVVAARGREAECAELVGAYLADRADLFDVAILEETPDRSAVGPLLHDALLRRGWVAARFLQERCPRTTLAGTWEETIARFKLDDRREVRRRLRNIQKEHRIELEVLPPGAHVEPAMREFIDMHQERWARDGYWGAFADPGMAEFHCDVAERLSRRGWLFLSFLRVDGRRWAVNYGFSFRDSVAVYLAGSREATPDLARHSPGRIVHALSMQWAIERGRTVYDFMRGTEPYKYELAAVDVPNWTIVAYPRRPLVTGTMHRLDLVLRGVARRSRRELQLLRGAARADGWLSTAVLRHVARGWRRAVKDLLGRLPPRRRAGLEPRS